MTSIHPCPACGHKLQMSLEPRLWLHCGNIFCHSDVCDNGQDGDTEAQAYNLLCQHQASEEPPRDPEPEYDAEEEADRLAWAKADYLRKRMV